MSMKIAVLGGGCGSMAAVWALTNKPDWRERFEITVYQVGWRLGGKCASGRDEKDHCKIYEHGLHVWGGFYQNAFCLMDKVYAELPRNGENPLAPPLPAGDPSPAWSHAFQRMSNVILQENVDGRFINWQLDMFEDPTEFPGRGGVMPSVWDYIKLIIHEIRKRFSQYAPVPEEEKLTMAVTEVLSRRPLTETSGSIFPQIFTGYDGTSRPSLDEYSVIDIVDAAKVYAESLSENADRHLAVWHDDILYFIERAIKFFIERHTIAGSDFRRRAEFILDFVVATFRGIIRSGVISGGWEVINHLEWREWLTSNCADPATLDSPLVRGIYDYVFAFVKGRPGDRNLEAGTGTHGVLRLFFTYHGAIFWEMLAGMGEVVFAPLYTVLKDRGVNFKFFSKVLNLEVGDGRVQAIKIEPQATTKDSRPYEPLITVKGVPAWPMHPRYDQLNEGSDLQRDGIDLESYWTAWKREPYRIEIGPNDCVLLGISIAALPEIAGDVANIHEPFRNMLNNIRTVQTHSMQLWLDADSDRLGASKIRRCTTAASEPMATWCDMSYLLDREEWPPPPQGSPPKPGYLAYFCGELDELEPQGSDYPKVMLEHFKNAIALDWLRKYTGSIWNKAVAPGTGGLDWSLLHDEANRTGEARLDAQYLRVNVNPSDRYVISFPGTSQWRLRPDQPVLPNLFIAGDWTWTPINAGCVEAAVMSGLYAARAISGDTDIEIIGG